MALAHALAAGLLVLAGMGSALAQSSGEASLSGFGYTLIDLDPTDTAAPAIAFRLPEDGTLFETGLGGVQITYTPYGPGPGREETVFGREQDLLRRSVGITKEHAGGQVETGGTALRNAPPDLSIGMRWETRGSEGEGARLHLVGAHEPAYFVLAPRTRVTFSTLLTVQAIAGTGSSHDEDLRLAVYLAVFNLRDPAGDQATGWLDLYAGNGAGEHAVLDAARTVQVSFDNRSDAPVEARASMHLIGTAHTIPVSAVPEPAPLAMLLAGGLLGLLRTRRRAWIRRPGRPGRAPG